MRHITLRQATAEDWPAIQRLHREHQAAQATNYELPNLFGPAIAIALVGEEAGGAIRNCIYVETIAELRFVGCDPKATAFGRREIEGLSYVLRLQGFRWLECFVPRPLKKMIQKPLRRAGFDCVDRELAHFAKDLRGKNDPESPAMQHLADPRVRLSLRKGA
jgi:hypothetical protein